ncbi:DNA ligase 3, partial [Zootermopsis nevadensis]|uniref:DNA ligase 3 n=1 Tax=Zootermopsis nevadensis TaxID=136037 RepID=UPI000B8E22C2
QKKFCAERARSGRAVCRKCKNKLDAGALRLAKYGYNPFGPFPMKMWHHVDCLFEVFAGQKQTTASIKTPDDIEGWSDLEEEDQDEILRHLPKCKGWTRKPKSPAKAGSTKPEMTKTSKGRHKGKEDSTPPEKESHKDNSFRQFRRLCATLSETESYNEKTAIVRKFFTKGTNGSNFRGDLHLWCRLLLPGIDKRVYNLQSKQLIKIFSKIFSVDHVEMLMDLERGDVAETVSVFFEQSVCVQPAKKSVLSLQDVSVMTQRPRSVEPFHSTCLVLRLTSIYPISSWKAFLREYLSLLVLVLAYPVWDYSFFCCFLIINNIYRCTANDLKMIIRLVKHDLRINAGPKHILGAVNPDAYQAFQTSRDLHAVLSKVVEIGDEHSSSSKKSALKITASVMTPILPMLAEACKSVEYGMKKCPNGMYSEIKYDGERVQVHKKGDEFKYFSRSLKPVLPHKVNTFKDYIPQAFPHGKDLILDSEILLIDVKTGKPLPFGSLGIHKKNAFKDANVCLFVFDCMYFNGEVLLEKPMKERRRILEENMEEVPNRIMFSEMKEINDPKDLEEMITKVLKLGLEGLVLKDLMSIYEPGKRHWLKVKKDYLHGGAMADSADLVVLGAWFGTGHKGGMMSVFLMGCYNPANQKWCTVTKVHTGHDDKTLERLQEELDMIKISKEASKVPDWLSCTKTMIPDFVARDPKAMPVWEITGAEFTQHEVHTASGISIRFPRVTKIRDDKTWETATSLPELKNLFKKSKENEDFSFPSTSRVQSVDRREEDKGSDSCDSHVGSSGAASAKNSSNRSKDKPSKTSGRSSKHKQQKSSDENIGSVARGGNDVTENGDDESPAKRRKTVQADSKGKSQFTIKKPLPDVFEGVRVVLPDSVTKDRRELERYFIAYGGELLDPSDKQESTHVIHVDSTSVENGEGIHVTLSWLWDSIKLLALQKPSRYAVPLPCSAVGLTSFG